MKTLLDLAAYCRKEGASIEKSASDYAVKLAEEILNDWVIVSPVDTSNLVSNFVVTLGAPATIVIDPYVAGKAGSTREESSTAALAAGLAVLKDKLPGVPIYITNNVHYAQYINDGTPYITAVDYIARAMLISRSGNAANVLRV